MIDFTDHILTTLLLRVFMLCFNFALFSGCLHVPISYLFYVCFSQVDSTETVSLSPPGVSKGSRLVFGSGSMTQGTLCHLEHSLMAEVGLASDFCTKAQIMALNLYWKPPRKDGPCTFKETQMFGPTWPSHGKKELA